MSQVFLIIKTNLLAKSLENYFKTVRGNTPIRILVPADPKYGDDDQWTAQVFRQIADTIEEQSGADINLLNAVAIVDLLPKDFYEIDDFNPIAPMSRENRWTVVIAMLVLAFPEIHWVFSSVNASPHSSLLHEAHTINFTTLYETSFNTFPFLALHDQGYTALFDAAGLRQIIRDRIIRTPLEDNLAASYIPARREFAASIDEERSYAYFNAYCAYRFGFRSQVVTSYGMMQRLFGIRLSEDNSGEDGPSAFNPNTANLPVHTEYPSLVFEDIYLRFPDFDSQVSLSDIAARDDEFPKLSEVKHRIFVTIGHRQTDDPDRWRKNRDYLLYLNGCMSNGQKLYNKILYKPLSGIFDLWNKAGLQRRLGTGKYKGRAEGYKWPPENLVTEARKHSSPGRLLLIAERLITRAERTLSSAQAVPEAVCGALLALEAQEYLGNRTPTTTLEALALKHRLEVLAECMFYGIEYNLHVPSRFQDVERELNSISEWFYPRKRYASKLNAEISILREMVLEFRNRNQFDEEQECLAKIRNIYRHLWFEQKKWWAWIFYPARWYLDFLLSSLGRFILMLAVWLIVFALIYSFVFPSPEEHTTISMMLHGSGDAINSFIGLSIPRDLTKEIQSNGIFSVCVSFIAVLLGFTHLGIFISHLYSIIARR